MPDYRAWADTWNYLGDFCKKSFSCDWFRNRLEYFISILHLLRTVEKMAISVRNGYAYIGFRRRGCSGCATDFCYPLTKYFEMSELCNNSGRFKADRMIGSDISVTFVPYDKRNQYRFFLFYIFLIWGRWEKKFWGGEEGKKIVPAAWWRSFNGLAWHKTVIRGNRHISGQI